MRRLGFPAVLLIGSCTGWNGGGPGCVVFADAQPLPEELAESSGVAASLRTPGVYWSHGDGRQGTRLWAVDAQGVVRGQAEIADQRVFDAEDIASADCAEGSCLYLADIGDNYHERDSVFVLRVIEPELGTTSSAGPVGARRYPIRYPDGPRDAEAIFVLPGEDLFVVSKGNELPVTLFRYPPPLRPDTLVTLEEVQRLSETARVLPRQVTGAAAARDGSLVVLRTYETLLFHRWENGALVPLAEEGTVNLRALRESQGEGVGFGEDGLVALTSESGPAGAGASIALLRCRFERGE
jgi:hypothetical protein